MNATVLMDPIVLRAIEIIAIMVAAFSGFAEAQRKQMDVVGLYTVAFITAFGGGTLRDILLDRRPLFWVEHQEYALLVFALSLVAFPLMKLFRQLVREWVIVLADAVGMGLFSVSATALSLQLGYSAFVSIMMGVITGCFGGILRDIICNEVPMILRDGKPYAICAFAGCGLYVVLNGLHMASDSALSVAVLAILLTRMIAWRKQWKFLHPGRSDDR